MAFISIFSYQIFFALAILINEEGIGWKKLAVTLVQPFTARDSVVEATAVPTSLS